ncbi:MAG: 2-oxo-4-hydroxy-4-carboxy-5-ureidoimidazoline decarboxylase, partial [Haloechinothrix sp.]
VDEVLPPAKLTVYGFQHVLAFYAGAVVVPLLLAGAIGLNEQQLAYLINADLFTCGIATLIQTIGFWKVGVRLPLIQGVTFTAVAPMIAIGQAAGGGVPGLREIYGAVIVAGIFAFLLAPFFARLVRFFPPIVTGTVITSIGLVLLPVAAMEAGGGNPGAEDFGSPANLAMASGTLIFILIMYRFFRGFLATIAVLIGLVVGTLIAWPLGYAHFDSVAETPWLGVTTPFHYGLPTFGLAAIVSMIVVMLITAVETTGDVFATGEIVRKKVGGEDVGKALRADGLATTIGGVLNSFPYTTFAENVGLVRLTRVRSRWVVATAGLFMIFIGLLPKTGAIVAGIPHAVLGGAALVLFGTVAVVGIQTLGRVDFKEERNVVILATSLGLALIPVGFPEFYAFLPEGAQMIFASGITMGSLSAIILNLVFNVLRRKDSDGVAALAPPAPVSIDVVNAMTREEFAARFGKAFQGGDWVAGHAAEQRPFAGVDELRNALHRPLFEAATERQAELIRSYPDLAGRALVDKLLGPESLRDQCGAGLHHLEQDEDVELRQINSAYRTKFGFPLVICVRGSSKDVVLATAESRIQNSPAQERAYALL